MSRVTLLTLLLAFAFLALFAAGTAGAMDYPNATAAPDLSAKLPTSVAVYCTANTNYDFAMIADRQVFLDTNACAALRDQPSSYSFGLAAFILIHEWWHVAFAETDEANTDLGAISVYRYLLRHYWHLSAQDAERDYLGITGPVGTFAPLRSNYHPSYTATLTDPLP